MMLVDLFGLDEPFEKIGKLEGQEVEMYLKELDGYVTFILTSERKNFECRATRANNPIAKIIITVEEEKILDLLSDIIRTKSNLLGLMKLIKFLIPRKIRIKGSLLAALKLSKCLMIGKNDVYKQKW